MTEIDLATTRKARREVWTALSDLFRDTETMPSDLWYIAEKLAQSEYDEQKLTHIYADEVAPVLVHNLLAPIGEWAGFDTDWLEQHLNPKDKPLYTFPVLGAMFRNFNTWQTQDDFAKIMERVRLLRMNPKPDVLVFRKSPEGDEDMLELVRCRTSGFADVRELFKRQGPEACFLDIAVKPKEMTHVVQCAGITIGGIRAIPGSDPALLNILQIQIMPPYFLDKLEQILYELLSLENKYSAASLELLNIPQFAGVPERMGFEREPDLRDHPDKLCLHYFRE